MNINGNVQSPNFGMAFRKPSGEALTSLTKSIQGSKAKERGLKQFIKEQDKLKHYDIVYKQYDDGMKVAGIIEKATGTHVAGIEQVGHQTGLDVHGAINYPGRKLIAKLFNPKKLLPKSLYLAGEQAKILEKAKATQLKAENFIDQIF